MELSEARNSPIRAWRVQLVNKFCMKFGRAKHPNPIAQKRQGAEPLTLPLVISKAIVGEKAGKPFKKYKAK
jgi:hypothetical protein